MSVDTEERDVKAVYVPCDQSEPVSTIIIHQAKDKALQCFIDHCRSHFAKKSLNEAQLQQVAKSLEKQAKSNANEEIIQAMARTTTCDMVVLHPNKKETDFVSVNVYVDDKGVAKQLPINHRATSIAMECGLSIQILGDAFIGKQFDDEEGFKRIDFTTDDLNTSLPWFKVAKKINLSGKAMNTEQLKAKVKETQDKSDVLIAERLKSDANELFKRGKFEGAAELYKLCLEKLLVELDKPGNAMNTSDALFSIVPPLLSNLSLCYLKLGDFSSSLQCAERCTDFRPKWFKGWGRRATASLELKNFEEASKFAHQALLLSEGNIDILALLDKIEKEEGNVLTSK